MSRYVRSILSLIYLVSLAQCTTGGSFHLDCDTGQGFQMFDGQCITTEECRQLEGCEPIGTVEPDPGATQEIPQKKPGQDKAKKETPVTTGTPTTPAAPTAEPEMCTPPAIHDPEKEASCPDEILQARQLLGSHIPASIDGLLILNHDPNNPGYLMFEQIGMPEKITFPEFFKKLGYDDAGLQVGVFAEVMKDGGGIDDFFFGLIMQFAKANQQFADLTQKFQVGQTVDLGFGLSFTVKQVDTIGDTVVVTDDKPDEPKYIFAPTYIIVGSPEMMGPILTTLDGSTPSFAESAHSGPFLSNCDYLAQAYVHFTLLTKYLRDEDLTNFKKMVNKMQDQMQKQPNPPEVSQDLEQLLKLIEKDKQNNLGFIEAGLNVLPVNDPKIYGKSVTQLHLALWNNTQRAARFSFEVTDKAFQLGVLIFMMDKLPYTGNFQTGSYDNCQVINAVANPVPVTCQFQSASLSANKDGLTLWTSRTDANNGDLIEQLEGLFQINQNDDSQADGNLIEVHPLYDPLPPVMKYENAHQITVSGVGNKVLTIKISDNAAAPQLCEVQCTMP